MGIRVDTAGGQPQFSIRSRPAETFLAMAFLAAIITRSGAAGPSELHDSFMRVHGDNDSWLC
jgi:hypothetical protein